jgi:hypothetical protein
VNNRQAERVFSYMRKLCAILVIVLASPFGLLRADDQGPVQKTGQTIKKTAHATEQTLSNGARQTGRTLSNGAKATARTVGKAIERTGGSIRNAGAS